MNKWRNLINIVLPIIIIIAVIAIFIFLNQPKINREKAEVMLEDADLEKRLNEIYSSITSGGPGIDGIPPIENPKYISIEEANNKLDDGDVVFLVEFENEVFVYPQKILVWHEIVNEEIGGEKVSITYCPLTGSAIGFKGKTPDIETTFGTSGKLSNSNLVMYDRETKSYIPQVFGMAVSGKLKGKQLEEFPVIFTRWKNIKQNYNEAKVLSDNTGYVRNYDKDPYGSYLKTDNYYDSGSPFFPVMNKDNRFEDKEVVISARIDNIPFAVLKKSVKEKKVLNFDVEENKLVAFYDEALDTVRLFERKHGDEINEFSFKDGEIIDDNSNSVWSARGEAVSGEFKGAQLNYINSFDVMWFAWVAFYQETEVYS